MTYTSSTPRRQSAPEIESDFPVTISAPESRTTSHNTVQHLRLLWDNRQFLFRTALLAVCASTVIAFLIPSQYEATTQIMPPDTQSGSMALLAATAGRVGALGAVAGDVLGMKSSGALFVGVLQSRTVQDRLIQDFNLQKVYRDSKLEDARRALAEHTGIAEDRKSGIISVTVTDHDPKRAASLAQAYVSNLDLLVAQVSTSSARRERLFLEERLAAVKKDLDDAATKFSEFASQNTAIDIPAQGKAMVEAAATLQGKLIAAESELRGVETIYADQNVRVRSLRARVAELHNQLDKLGGDSPAGPSKGSAPLYPSIRQLPLLGVTYADLFRRTKIEETVFELLTQQYELAKVQEAKEIPTVKVLDVAIVPTKKVFPHRLILILAGTAFITLAACALLFVRQAWEVMDPHDPRKQFAKEVASTLRTDATRLANATRRQATGVPSSSIPIHLNEPIDEGPKPIESE